MMKRRAGVALAIALALLALFIVAVGWEEVLTAVRRASLRLYLLAFVASLGCLLCRSLVWHRTLSLVDQPRPYWLVSGVFLTAMFAKYVTPYGQVASGVGVAAIVSRYYDSAYEEALAAVVSADFCNYLPYYTFGSAGLGYVLLVHSPSVDLAQYASRVTATVAAVLLLAGAVWLGREQVRSSILRLVAALRRLLARISPEKARHLRRDNLDRRFEGFATTLEFVSRDRATMAAVLAYAHLGWLAFAAALYVSAAAVGEPIPFAIAVLAVALSKVGFVVPAPGGLGGVEAALAGALYFLTPMSAAVALAVTILYRFATYWFTVLLGGGASIALTLKDPLPPEDG